MTAGASLCPDPEPTRIQINIIQKKDQVVRGTFIKM